MAHAAQAAPAALDSEWLDEMVKKLQTELQAQLDRVAKASADAGAGDHQARAADARTLASLERTLERLARLERERAVIRETKIQKHDTGARAALERRLDKLAAAPEPRKSARKP